MSKKRIIIVDDKPVYRNAMKTLIRKISDVEIIEAADGFEFLEYIANHPLPDIVLLDIEMPGINGIETARKALEIYPDLIIYGLSLFESDEYVQEMLNAGAKGYLLKLSDNTALLREILLNSPGQLFLSKEIEYLQEKKTTDNVILIVDDFQVSNNIVGNELIKQGYKVLQANNGNEALQYFDGRKIDMVLSDYLMPKMDGINLAKEIRKKNQYQNIPIFILSSVKEEERNKLSEEVQITGWIQKPFDPEFFIPLLTSYFKNK